MKLSNLFYVGALSALALTSCKSNDDNSEWLGSDGVNFTSYIEGLTSRASGSAWDDGDRVGIFMTAGADEFANREYTASAAGNLTPAGQALKWPEEGSASFMAYYPYTASLSGKTYTVNVTDQTDPKKIDLLYSNNAADIANSETVNLAFKHQLSQIVINVEKDATIESTNGLAIAISGMDTQASFDLNDGTLTPGGNKGNIAMNVNAEGTQAEAIVIPAADLSGAKMTFTLQGMSFDYDVTGTYEAGTKYTYKATLSVLNGQPTVTMGTATIEDWKDQAGGDINVDFEEGEAPSGEEFVALNESFATGQGAFTINDITKPNGSGYVWSFDDRGPYMKASAFISGTDYASESWLISPAIDLTKATTATLSFMHIINYTDAPVGTYQTLWVTEASNENWQQVTIPNYPSGTSWDEASSGDIDLSAFAGKTIKIGFKYTSIDGDASTWEVYNIKVVGNPGGGSGTVDPEPEPTPGEGAYTSNITLPTNPDTEPDENKATGPTIKIDGIEYSSLKLGTSKVVGSWTSNPIPANATSLSFYAIAWKGKTSELTISIENGGTFDDGQASKTIELAANSGATGNAPFTITTPSASDYKTFTLKDITASTTIKFSTGEGGSDPRAILFGINVK